MSERQRTNTSRPRGNRRGVPYVCKCWVHNFCLAPDKPWLRHETFHWALIMKPQATFFFQWACCCELVADGWEKEGLLLSGDSSPVRHRNNNEEEGVIVAAGGTSFPFCLLKKWSVSAVFCSSPRPVMPDSKWSANFQSGYESPQFPQAPPLEPSNFSQSNWGSEKHPTKHRV